MKLISLLRGTLLIMTLFFHCSLFGQQDDRMNVMPVPSSYAFEEGSFEIEPGFRIYLLGTERGSRLEKAATRFLRQVSDKTGVFFQEGFPYMDGEANQRHLTVEVRERAELKMGVDESYELTFDAQGLRIRANTDLGAMHGLQTAFQLIEPRDGAYVFPAVQISDEPRFPWRGLMMDVARHFMPVDVIKRNLDAMALVKMNVLHWHLSDDQGFRVEVRSLPRLHEEASDGMYYTQEQIKDIVKYADDRGIRVVPEFDVPGHGTAFLTAYPEFASNTEFNYSLERNAGIFDPTLDPTNDAVYEFLDQLFEEVTPLFPDAYFHIGGDENEGKHWDANPEIQAFMAEMGLEDNHALQTYFNIKLEKILNAYGKRLMGWEEIMTPDMPKTALIHSWRGVNEGLEPGQSLVEAVRNGYETILSNGYYIDLMLSVEDHYLVDPMPDQDLSEEQADRILGGEATMWSELVTPFTVDSRIWPRTAAIAERFWSPQEVRDLDDMHRRLERVGHDLERIGSRHLQGPQAILRNIANYGDVSALDRLRNVSEPFKIYTRNKGGTEYKVYAPFRLFADACTADAADNRPFELQVDRYMATGSQESREAILAYLRSWTEIYGALEDQVEQAPLISKVLPYAKRVQKLSSLVIGGINKGYLEQAQMVEVREWAKTSEDPALNLDVEFAPTEKLLELTDYLLQQKK